MATDPLIAAADRTDAQPRTGSPLHYTARAGLLAELSRQTYDSLYKALLKELRRRGWKEWELEKRVYPLRDGPTAMTNAGSEVDPRDGRERSDDGQRVTLPRGMVPREWLTNYRRVATAEGEALYVGERDGAYYVVNDGGAMLDMLDQEDAAGIPRYVVRRFESEASRARFVESRLRPDV